MAKKKKYLSMDIPQEVQDAFNRSQELLEEHVILGPEQKIASLQREIRIRNFGAQGLWIVYGLVSLLVIFISKIPKEVMLIIPALAFIENRTKNLQRYMSLLDAQQSYKNFRDEAIEYHQIRQQKLFRQPRNFQFFLDSDDLNIHVVTYVLAGNKKIENALTQSQTEVLKALSVDKENRGSTKIKKKIKS
jgi:hypothetical protein